MLERLHRIRASNAAVLTRIVQSRIDEGILENVPPYFHVCAAWALAHGAVALMQSKFYNQVIEDKDGFLDFLLQTGIRMGNVGQYKRD
jgi:hypothetical protein